MNIVINALAVDGGGGQTYLENLLPELNRLDRENHYFVLLRRQHSVNVPPLSSNFKIITFLIPRPFLIGRFLIEQFLLPFWLGKKHINLLYSPADATTLFSPCPVVLAMRNPNLYVIRDIGWSPLYRLKFYVLGLLAKLSTRKATRIIFVSKASERLVGRRITVPPEKKNVIYHGVSPSFFEKNPPIPEIGHILKDKQPYILSVSSVYRYKNYIRLIEAFCRIRNKLKKPYHLLIVGSSFDNDYYEKMLARIQELQAENHVHYIGGFPLKQLPPIYQGAELFAFPSFLETFGHTLVEAMASQLPIVAGDIETTREITGGAAYYFNPFNIDSIGDALLEVLSNDALQKDLIARGKEQVTHFSWKRCVQETLAVFYNAMDRSMPSAIPRVSLSKERRENRASR